MCIDNKIMVKALKAHLIKTGLVKMIHHTQPANQHE